MKKRFHNENDIIVSLTPIFIVATINLTLLRPRDENPNICAVLQFSIYDEFCTKELTDAPVFLLQENSCNRITVRK